jgi:hypothetical protein
MRASEIGEQQGMQAVTPGSGDGVKREKRGHLWTTMVVREANKASHSDSVHPEPLHSASCRQIEMGQARPCGNRHRHCYGLPQPTTDNVRP